MKEQSLSGVAKLLAGMSSWTFFTVFFRALSVLSISKLTAIFFGAPGIALLSHFQNLVSIFTQISDQGNSFGIIRELNIVEGEKKGNVLGSFVAINLLIFLGLIVIFLVFNQSFIRHFDISEYKTIWIVALLVSVFFILINSFNLAILYAHRAFRFLTLLTVLNFILLVALYYYSLSFEDISISLVTFSIGSAINSILNFLLLKQFGYYPDLKFKGSRETFKRLSKFFIMAASVVVFGKFTDFFVRDFSLEWFGENATGYWQAQVKISESYRSVYMGVLGVVVYSTMSKMQRDQKKLKAFLVKVLQLSVLLLIPALLSVWLLRNQLINLFFNEQLLPAADFIEYQIISDFFALFSLPLVYIMVLKNRLRAFIGVHFLSAIFFVFFIIILTAFSNQGIASLPISNMLRMVPFLVTLFLLNRKEL